MFHLGGHGQDVGAQRVAGGADGIGSLLGMSALPALPAGGASASFDVEFRDERRDAWQIGLILHDLALLVQLHMTRGTFVERNVDDAIDLSGRGQRSQIGFVSFAPADSFLAGLGCVIHRRCGRSGVILCRCRVRSTAKGMGLALRFPLEFIKQLAQSPRFFFKAFDASIPFSTARTGNKRGAHGGSLKLCSME
jgi:hypothetical protein